MPFVNPLVVTVPLAEIDYFFWPCMSGEKYPPTLAAVFGSTAVYASAGVYPCLQLNGPGGAGTATESWPPVSAYSPRTGTFTGLTFTGKFQVSNTGPGTLLAQLFFLGAAVSTGFQCTVGTSTFTVAVLWFNSSGGFTIPGTFANGVWHDFSYTITATGNHSASVDTTTGSRANTGVPTMAAQYILAANGNGTNVVTPLVSQLKVAYS